jgi:ankyrin repeat protein
MSSTDDLFEAIKSGDVAKTRELLSADPSLAGARDANGLSAVLLAVYYGREEILINILAKEPDLDLFESCAVGRLDLVKRFLVEAPERVNEFAGDGFTSLGLAAFFGHEPVVEELLAAGADVNLSSNNAQRVAPLHSAIAGQHFGITEKLLSHGANVNARQESDFTPLHQAAHNGHRELVQLLLSRGADRNAQMKGGPTALDLALQAGHTHLGELL